MFRLAFLPLLGGLTLLFALRGTAGVFRCALHTRRFAGWLCPPRLFGTWQVDGSPLDTRPLGSLRLLDTSWFRPALLYIPRSFHSRRFLNRGPVDTPWLIGIPRRLRFARAAEDRRLVRIPRPSLGPR